MGELSYTTSGDSNLVSFKSAARVPITFLKTHFKPKQNFNGYDRPWIGGSRKNLLGFTTATGIANGSNKTINFSNDYIYIEASDTVTTNGIITYFVITEYCKTILLPGTYTFSISDFTTNLENISKNNISMIIGDQRVSDGATFTISENGEIYGLNYSSNIIWNNGSYMQFRLQIEEGSSVTNWEPYENICPIEGWQGAEVYQDSVYSPNEYQKIIPITFPAIGKNLLNKNNYGFKAYDSIVFGGNNSSARPDGTLILDAGTYTLSVNTTMTVMGMAHENGQQGAVVTNTNQMTFTCTSKEAVRLIILLNGQSSDHDMLQYEYQLELGDTATEYEPFNNTVYGGYVDLITGEVTETYKYLILNASSNWIQNGQSIFYTATGDTRDKKKGSAINFYCNILSVGKPLTENTAYIQFMSITTTGLGIMINNSSLTLTEIQNLSANNQIIICYELETPVIYKLSPIQLKTLLNQNYIWSNTNDITEVSYAVHDSSMIRSSKKQIIGNEPHIETVNEDIASFKTDMIAPLKSAEIYFEPIQEGSGDPSPSNIRVISGWNNLLYINYNSETNKLHQIADRNIQAYGLTIIINNNGKHFSITGTATDTRRLNCCAAAGTDTPLYITGLPVLTNGATWSIYKDNTPIEEISDVNGKVYIAGASSNYLRLGIQLIEGTYYNVEFDPIFTEYPPLSISWQSTAGTIYGGYIDLITGELIQTHNILTINNTNITIDRSMTSNGYYTASISHSTLTNYPAKINYLSNMTLCLFDYLNGQDGSGLSSSIYYDNGGYIAGNTKLILKFNINNITTDEAFLQYLQNNPLTCIYELATPITYQLSPQTLKTLRGQNNIWSNSNGPIDIKYWTH